MDRTRKKRIFIPRSTGYSDASVILEETFQRVGMSLPNYKTSIALCQPASTTLSWSSKQLNKYQPGFLRQVKQDKTLYSEQTHTGLDLSLDSAGGFMADMSAAQNRALIGIIKKIRTNDSNLSGPMFLGELRETIGMIRSPVKALRDHANSLVYSFKKRRSSRKTAAETWLEWSFGAAPLMSDIAAILESARPRLERPAVIKRLSFSAQDAAQGFVGSSQTYAPNAIRTLLNTIETCEASVRYLVGVRQQAIVGAGSAVGLCKKIADVGRFQLNEIIPTAWELMPWSFLYDYFMNIGSLLECMYDYNSRIVWAQVTKVQRTKTIRWSSDFEPVIQGYSLTSNLGERLEVTNVSGTRQPLSQLGFPSLAFSLPGHPSQFLNLAALAHLKL